MKYVLFQPGQGWGQRALKYSKKCSKEVPFFTVPSLTTTTPKHGTAGVVPSPAEERASPKKCGFQLSMKIPSPGVFASPGVQLCLGEVAWEKCQR